MNDLFGEKQPSDGIKQFISWAIDEAERATGHRPDWARRSSPKEFKSLKRMYQQITPYDRLQAAWRAYLQEQTTYYAGHPPSLLLAHIDRFLSDGRRDNAWDQERQVHEAVASDGKPDPYHARADRYAELAQTHGREKARELASAEFPGLEPI